MQIICMRNLIKTRINQVIEYDNIQIMLSSNRKIYLFVMSLKVKVRLVDCARSLQLFPS